MTREVKTVGPIPDEWLFYEVLGRMVQALQPLMPCAYCGAGRGEPCRTRGTQKRATYDHTNRWEQAQAIARDNAEQVIKYARDATTWHRQDVTRGLVVVQAS